MPEGVKAQNAIEYMAVYSWAILALVLIIVMFYFYARIPGALVPSSCTFTGGISCNDFVVGATASDNTTTYIAFLLSNAEPYAMEQPLLSVQFNQSNVTAPCAPSYAAPGATITCELTIGTGMKMGDLLRAPIYVRATYCGLSMNTSTCYDAPEETYKGNLNAIDSQLVSNSITLQVYTQNDVVPANGVGDSVYARYFFFGAELRGIPINFSVNSTSAHLNLSMAMTDSNGYAHDSVYAVQDGKVAITAKYGGSSNSTVVNFTGG
jgi:hypothetical protein